MKKIVYSFLMFAITISGASMVSADELRIPVVYHYGNTAYTQINIKNLDNEVVQLSVQFAASTTKSASARTNTGAATNVTASLAPGQTWTVLTKDTTVYGSTASLKRVAVTIQTSATNHPPTFTDGSSSTTEGGYPPGAGKVVANAMFIYVNAGAPSGFQFPTMYRNRTWVSTLASGAVVTGVGQVTIDNWRQ